MKLRLLIATAALLSFASCSKDGVEGNNCQTCSEMRIVVTLKHHDDVINTGKVYLKRDATNMPDSYDASAEVVMTDEGPMALFLNQRPGKFYIYADGYDTSINKDVAGGVPVNITSDFMFKYYRMIVPVTEK
ncbi:MAG: hypothetical protein KDC07_04915 [Chitinophagaceae bacterium]|nr:hypothetical protein [Chitinophagaceae bacterium]MCB9046705.1 hypothetical protein [Chitinophagales bacterium]